MKKKKGNRTRRGGYPVSVAGMDAIARLIAVKYNRQCSRQYIMRWRNLVQVPAGCTEQFPAPKESNRYNMAECFAWCDRYLEPAAEKQGETQDLLQLQFEAKAKNDIEKLEHERWGRERDRGLWLKKLDAERTIIGALRQYHGAVRSLLERQDPAARRDKLRDLGVDADLVAAFFAFDLDLARATVDAVETRCKELSK